MVVTFHQTPVIGSMDPVPPPEKKVVVQHKTVYTHKKKEFYEAPVEIKGYIEKISEATNVPYKDIEKVMWCESSYNPKAKHVNKNSSIDRGLMQINSIHDDDIARRGMDMYNAKDNTDYAIILINNKQKQNKPPLEDWICKA